MLPELPIEDPILQITLLLAVIWLVKVALERLFLPGLLGLLVLGMLIGPGGGELVAQEPVVQLFGDIGLVYIMFMAGLEVNLDIVREHKRETLLFGLLAFSCSLLPGAALGLFLGYPLAAALLLGTLVSSHTLLAFPIIERLKLLSRKSVVAAVGGTMLTDTSALVMLVVTLQTAATEGGEGPGGWLLPLALLATLVAVSLTGLTRLSLLVLRPQWVTAAEKSLFALVVLLVLSSVAELIGTEKIIGAFLAGICLNKPLREKPEIRAHVEFVGGMLFIPFFFVSTGMLLELRVFTGQGWAWILAALLLAIVLVGKTTASWIIGKVYNYSRTERWLMVGLTTPQAAATLAVAVSANEAGLLGSEVIDAVIILILATCLTGPLLTRYAGSKLAGADGKRANERG